jgi:hypothetical protein
MLENSNPECVDLLGTLRAVSGTEILIQQIENFNFEEAARLLAKTHARLLAELHADLKINLEKNHA